MNSTEQSIQVNKNLTVPTMWVSQEVIDGILALIHWLRGFEASGQGDVPGHFELVMHYRILRDAIRDATKADVKE